LVIDNDVNGETTELFKNLNDDRLRVVRTGGLSMPDNWEQAFVHAKGEYVMVLGNKYRIDPNLLGEVEKYIQKNLPSVICTELSFFRFPKETASSGCKFNADGWAVIPSELALNAISQLDFGEFFNIAPFGYKAIISLKFIRETQARLGRFAFPVAPDFTMGYLSLLLNKEYHAYNRHYTTVADNAPSNGLSDNYDGPLIQEFRSSLSLGRSLAEFSPIPEIEHGYNMLVSDFFYISSLVGIEYSSDWLNAKKYMVEVFRSLMVRHLMFHLDVTRELKLLYAYAENNDIMWSREVQEVIGEYNHRYLRADMDSMIRIGRSVSRLQGRVERAKRFFWKFFGTYSS
jgi:hypothetical protein